MTGGSAPLHRHLQKGALRMEVDAKPGEAAPLVEFWMLGKERAAAWRFREILILALGLCKLLGRQRIA